MFYGNKMRTAVRKDRNHKEISDAFKKFGWAVKDVSQLPNFVDILVSKKGVTICVEIKDGEAYPSDRKLTKGEQEFKDMWQGAWELVESVEDVLELDESWGFE